MALARTIKPLLSQRKGAPPAAAKNSSESFEREPRKSLEVVPGGKQEQESKNADSSPGDSSQEERPHEQAQGSKHENARAPEPVALQESSTSGAKPEAWQRAAGVAASGSKEDRPSAIQTFLQLFQFRNRKSDRGASVDAYAESNKQGSSQRIIKGTLVNQKR